MRVGGLYDYIMSLSTMTSSMTTLSIITLSTMTLIKMTLIMKNKKCEIEHLVLSC
jgi:hypothetical protein